MKINRPRRQHLLEIASDLFSKNGYHNTGVDAISKHSGVSKTTLYKYFDSKEDMILEILERQHEGTIAYIEGYIAKSRESNPEYLDHQHIPAIFDAVKDWMSQKDFSGCNFINASAEFGNPNDPIHLCAAKHKINLRTLVFNLLTDLPDSLRLDLSEQIAILIDGAIVVAHVRMDKSTINTARTTLDTLLNQHFSNNA